MIKAQMLKEIQSLFNKIAKSFDKKDAAGVVDPVLPDAVLLYLDGAALTIQEWRRSARYDFSATQSMRSKFKVEKIDPAGRNAVVWYTETHEYFFKSNKKLKYRSINKWSSVLSKTSRGWKIRYFVQLSEGIKVTEEKPVKH